MKKTLLVVVMVVASVLLALPTSASTLSSDSAKKPVQAYLTGADGKPTSTFRVEGDSYREEAMRIFVLLNKEREANGVSPLEWNEPCYYVAKKRAFESSVHFAHERPDGRPVKTIGKCLNGENLGLGPKGTEGAEAVMRAWMRSPGHRKNMLRPEYQSVSIATIMIDDTLHWVQVFSVLPAEGPQGNRNPDTTDAYIVNTKAG